MAEPTLPDVSAPKMPPPDLTAPNVTPSDATQPGATPSDHSARPYTVLSCCMSMDGYIGSATGGRLSLSNADDFDRVDAVRAGCDAILVGAQTIRSDNPRLLVRSPTRRAARRARGLPEHPVKVTLTSGAELDCGAAFFTTGVDKIVYCPSGAFPATADRLAGLATVVDGGPDVRVSAVSADLFRRGVRQLLVEGGGSIHTQFLVEDVADELHLVVAPIFVGDGRARRFVDDGRFPWHPSRRGRLADVRRIGDVAVLTYALSDRFDPDGPLRDGTGVP